MMQMRKGKERWSNVLFWAAISLSSVIVFGRGHEHVLNFVMGVAGAIFVVSLGRLAYCKLRQHG
jgi:Mn2+/Fe2+ NRAMP family transporter